jgi:hypothetical protein
MADMSYVVTVTRKGDAWLADVPAVAGALICPTTPTCNSTSGSTSMMIR